MLLTVGKGQQALLISVRPSVCLSVRPWHTQRIIPERVPEFERNISPPQVRLAYQFQGQTVKDQGWGIPCRPNPAATLIVLVIITTEKVNETT